MALNDYADRDLDRVERPERPVPSGRVTPGAALAVASALTVTGLASAAVGGGRQAARVALPLAAVVWSYDLALKDTRLGPVAMAAARALDVLLGAGGDLRRAALPSAALALHTGGVTVLSRGEVHGATSAGAALVTAGTAATGAGVALGGWAGGRAGGGRAERLLGAGLAAAYTVLVGRAQVRAVRSPDAATVRSATGTGIRGMIPLQAALTARAGRPRTALALLGAVPLAKVASRVVSPT